MAKQCNAKLVHKLLKTEPFTIRPTADLKFYSFDRLSLYSSLYICLLKCQHPSLYIHTCMCHIVLWTYHLIKNRICPSISVAPRISSATSPLRNPLGSLGSGTSTLLLWFSPMCREVISLISCNTSYIQFSGSGAAYSSLCPQKIHWFPSKYKVESEDQRSIQVRLKKWYLRRKQPQKRSESV